MDSRFHGNDRPGSLRVKRPNDVGYSYITRTRHQALRLMRVKRVNPSVAIAGAIATNRLVLLANRRVLVKFSAPLIELAEVLVKFIAPFISITFVIQSKMKVFVMNVPLFIEFTRLFVEFIGLFSNNALVLLKSSAIGLAVSRPGLINGSKITDTLGPVSTFQLPQKHQFQSLGKNAILER